MKEKEKLKFQEKWVHQIRSFKIAKGITQVKLAQMLGVTPGIINKLENPNDTNNKAVTSYAFFKKWANIFEMSVSELISIVDDGSAKEAQSSWKESLFKVFSGMDAKLQMRIFRLFRSLSLSDLENLMKFILRIENLNQKEKEYLFHTVDFLFERQRIKKNKNSVNLENEETESYEEKNSGGR